MAPSDRRCLLGLGSNLGNRLANLQDALRRLEPDVRVIVVSSLYESEPVGPTGQSPYLNAVAAGGTALDPLDLLHRIKDVEWSLGRRPGPRWGPRPADIDILHMDGIALNTPDLIIPHARIGERPFVLVPLAEVAPDLVLADGMGASEAATATNRAGLRLVAGSEWRDAVAVFPPAVRADSAQV